MVVTAQPTVSAMILTPVADRKEGGQVDMKCTATNLESDHIVEWATEDPEMSLRWGMSTLATNPRFMFTTTYPQTGTTIQDFTITDLQRDDTDEYVCKVNDPIQGGGNNILATSNVTLSVFYYPNESFPMCSPAGPIRVDTGTDLNMKCSSESGNSAVTMQVSEIATMSTNIYTWTNQTINDTIVRSLDLTVDVADDNVTFECFISSVYFPGMGRSCTIGPINVATGNTTDTSNPATIAGAVVGGVVALLLIVFLIVLCRRQGLFKMKRKSQNPKSNTNTTNVEIKSDQPVHSQRSFINKSGVDIHEQSHQRNQQSILHKGRSYARHVSF